MNPFRYAGEYFDVETGTYYLRARYLDTSTGRFTQEDPIRHEERGGNFYVYAANDPVNRHDPTGLASKSKYGGAEKYIKSTSRSQNCYAYSLMTSKHSMNEAFNPGNKVSTGAQYDYSIFASSQTKKQMESALDKLVEHVKMI